MPPSPYSKFDIETLLEISRQNAEALDIPWDSGPAVTCTRTLSILPLRYAAVGGNPGLRQRLPTLPEHLRTPQQSVTLQQADYAIRPLREGFLYVMEKRKSTGQRTLHTPYRIDANGALSLVDRNDPDPTSPAPFSFQEVMRKTGMAFKVHDLEDLLELRLLYSPDPLTDAARQHLLRRYDSLPAVDVARFASPLCPTPRPHVLSHDHLHLVADFAAESDPALRRLLDAQVFNVPSITSLTAVRHALAPEQGQTKPRGLAVVVDDAIGITQELNAWRNDGLEHLKRWLETTHPVGTAGPSNERKVLVAQAFTELHRQFSERKVAALVSRHQQALRAHLADSDQAVPSHLAPWWSHLKEGLLDGAGELKRQDLEARAQRGEFTRHFEERYLPRVDLAAMHVQLDRFELASREAQHLAEARSADHLAWLTSTALLDALAHYDHSDLTSGQCFAHQTGLCVLGLEAVPAGARLLAQWWQADELTPDNLALRAFTFNQRDIAEVLARTRQALDALPPGSDPWQQLDNALKQAKELSAEFSRVDSHLDLLAQHSPINTAGALAWLGQLGRQSLQAGAPNSLDRLLYRRLSTYLVASLGQQALDLRLTEQALQGHTPSPGRVAGPIVRRLDQAYVDSLQGRHSHALYRLRLASGLLMLEAGLLLLQGRHDDKDRRFWSEIVAAGLTSAAAGMEVLAVGTEQALESIGRNSVTARGAEISLGRYRLWGAGLAALGGLVSMAWDFSDAKETYDKSKPDLSAAYSLRAISTAALLFGQGGIAFAQARAYLEWLALRARDTATREAFGLFAHLSARLSGNHIAMLWLSRMSWIGGGVVLATSAALLIIDEDALEKWCGQCCFRRKTSDRGYATDTDELRALFAAMDEVI